MINQLTDLPPLQPPQARLRQDPDAAPRGDRNLAAAGAEARGAAADLAQSIAFIYEPERRADQGRGRAAVADAPAPLRRGGRGDDRRSSGSPPRPPALEGVVLRYGWFYGPGTTTRTRRHPAADVASAASRSSATAAAIFSYIHVDDAASATVAALDHGSPGHLQHRGRRPRAGCASGCPPTPRRSAPSRRARSHLARPRSPAAQGGGLMRPRCAAPPTRRRSASWAGRRVIRAGARASPSRSAMSGREPPRDPARRAARARAGDRRGDPLERQTAEYYVDAKRALLRPPGLPRRRGAARGRRGERGATAVGGHDDGRRPARLRRDRRARGRRAWSPSSSARNARSTACSAGSRARCSSRAPAAWSSRTWSPPAAPR